MKTLTEKELWQMVAVADYKSDGDYKRIGESWALLPIETQKQIAEFIRTKQNDLYDKYEDAWLGKDGGDGIGVSDDGWNDLTADVVSRGEEFYDNISVAKMQEMADDMDYQENFLYAIQYTPYWDLE